MPEDEFRTELLWPTDPLGEREPAAAAAGAGVERPSAVRASDAGSSLPDLDRWNRAVAEAEEQLRQLRSTAADLGRDLAELRRAVTDWPELARVSTDVAALREDVAALLARRRPAPGPVRTEGAQSGSIGETLSELRDEIAALRRRISLRAPGSAPLSRDDIDRLADALIDRGVDPGDRQRR